MSVGPLLMWAGEEGAPNFVLDTGATENAAGVRTLQHLLQSGIQLKRVDLRDRPTFRFGDGLSLRSTSRVDLCDTSLGDISFYVLDGDDRVTTRHSENTPLLVGSRFLHEHRACVSYEHLNMFLQAPTGQILSAPGHLVLDPKADPTNLTILKEKAEVQYGVRLPGEAARLLELFSSPGALEALRTAQAHDREIEATATDAKQQGTRVGHGSLLELEGAGSLSFEVHRHHSCEPREHHVPHLSHELCGQPLAE